MAVTLDPALVNSNIIHYYSNVLLREQLGGGANQLTGGIAVAQTGGGIGSFLGKLARRALPYLPIITDSIARLGRGVISDYENKVPFLTSLKNRGREVVTSATKDIMSMALKQRGFGGHRRRKGKGSRRRRKVRKGLKRLNTLTQLGGAGKRKKRRSKKKSAVYKKQSKKSRKRKHQF
jgi:hypothetical protein